VDEDKHPMEYGTLGEWRGGQAVGSPLRYVDRVIAGNTIALSFFTMLTPYPSTSHEGDSQK
jgi:hypothetical protein